MNIFDIFKKTTNSVEKSTTLTEQHVLSMAAQTEQHDLPAVAQEEQRAEQQTTQINKTDKTIDEDAITVGIMRMIYSRDNLTEDQILQIPVVSACIDIIGGIISELPIKLYKKNNGIVEEIKNDNRVYLLNVDNGDTLTPTQFWKAICEDYFLHKGAYVYINSPGSDAESLHYVKENQVNTQGNVDPIWKDYNIWVYGRRYFPSDFIKFLRHTKNGWSGEPIIERNRMTFNIAYNAMIFQNALMKKGGNKKGFLEADHALTGPAMRDAKENWNNVFENNSENMMVLNKGMKFQDSSQSPREMQVDELKISGGGEIAMLFGIRPSLFYGEYTEEDRKALILHCITPVLSDFEASLDRDFLKEWEKESGYYWAFDTKEITRGGISERFEAYKAASEIGLMGVDEMREAEDLRPLGINFIKLGLDNVLYNPDNGQIYTPNTDKTYNIKDLGKGGTKENESETNR